MRGYLIPGEMHSNDNLKLQMNKIKIKIIHSPSFLTLKTEF